MSTSFTSYLDDIIYRQEAQLSQTNRRDKPCDTRYYLEKQELRYRKQIARQLRTQHVDGIYNNPVILKSRLRVTQGHLKRNHWIDYTRLRPYY